AKLEQPPYPADHDDGELHEAGPIEPHHALRMVWFYWAGLVKFAIVMVGWVWGLLKLGVHLIVGTIKSAITSPLAVLDATSRRPGVPWAAFFLLIVWSAVEATIFTFTLRPTMSELLAD